jgi:hypothetical protein
MTDKKQKNVKKNHGRIKYIKTKKSLILKQIKDRY